VIDVVALLPLWRLDTLIWRAEPPELLQEAWSIAYAFVGLGYSIVCHACWGQTVGKRLMGIRVEGVSSEPLRFLQAVLRDAVPFLFVVCEVVTDYLEISLFEPNGGRPELGVVGKVYVLWMAAEFVTMLAKDRRRSVHDWMAGSVVVRVER